MSAPRAHPLNGGYDQSLLAETPEVSRAAKQEGYNVNLLDERLEVRVNPTPRNTDPQSVVPKEHYQSIGPGAGARKVSYWRTRNGMTIIAIAAIVIVGAVVGGAVGGTVGKTSHKDAATGVVGVTVASATTTSSQNSPPQAPVASAPSTGSNTTDTVTSPNPGHT